MKELARKVLGVHDLDVLGRSCLVPPPAVGADPRLVLHRITDPDDPLLLTCGPRSRRRLLAGDVAFVATVDGQLAAWTWVSRQPVVHCRWSGLHFRLAPHEAYIYDLYTFPDFRHTKAGAFVVRGLVEDARRTGEFDWVFGYVMRENRPSQLMLRLMLGFEQVQVVKDLQVLSRFGVQLPFTEDPRTGPVSRQPRVRPAGAPVVARVPAGECTRPAE
jgi:ribosomal protein S18 acetylase RimI-like enzyme